MMPRGKLDRLNRAQLWTVVRLLLGVSLLVTAGLKLVGWNLSPVPRVGWFGTPGVQLAAAEWEIVLGIWLLLGRHQVWSWLAAVGTFVTFAVVSAYLGSRGVASCGCFGTVKASPWHVFAVDLATLMLLALFRPDLRELQNVSRIRLRMVAVTGLGIATLLALSTGSLIFAFGSLERAVTWVRGEDISVSTAHVDFGEGEPGEPLESAVEIRNWSSRPVRLIGGTSDCSCSV